jgi:iron-sulfur cluster assembly protein
MTEVMHHTSNIGYEIELTLAAKKQLLTVVADNKNATGVRLWVKESGCSGFSYKLDCVTKPESQDIPIPLNDTYQLYIDKASYPVLKGITIDYVREGLNYKLVFNNPNQTGECGCGESFTIT